MSQSRIFNIPKFKIYEKDEDKYSGWYKYGDLNQAALRVGNSDLGLDGEIRFNKNTKVFEGYNGSKWVILDSSKGDEGKAGKDFNEIIKFTCDQNKSALKSVSAGNIIDPSEINVSKNNSEIGIRKITSEQFPINGKSYNKINIKENKSTIQLDVVPQPYTWNMSNINLDELAIPNRDNSIKCYGETALYKIANEYEVHQGEILQIVIQNGSMVVKPLTYKNNGHAPNLYGESINIAGVSLNSVKSGLCTVCTKGITMVKVSNESRYLQIDNNVKDGNNGLVNFEGKIVKTNRKPLHPYIKAGNFIGNHTIEKNKLLPFKVDISIMDD
jgi:hypothetical protein